MAKGKNGQAGAADGVENAPGDADTNGAGAGTAELDLDAGEIDAGGAVTETPPDGTALPGAATAPVPAGGVVSALILRDCGFGVAGSVVVLDSNEAETGAEQGALDLAPAAVNAAGG